MSSLLLLPAPPSPLTRPALNTLYRPSIASALTALTTKATSPSRLVIATACPLRSSRSGQIVWQHAQSTIAGLYVLVATICAEQGIATDIGATEPGSVDVRILLVHHVRGYVYEKDDKGRYVEDASTIVPDLAAFATRMKPWETIFHPGSEEGYELLKSLLALAQGKQKISQQQIQAVDAGTAVSVRAEEDDGRAQAISGYGSVALGGTFDHLHPGHKLLLHAAALLLSFPAGEAGGVRDLVVGISADELLVNKKFAEQLQSWDARAASVLSFLSTILDLSTSDQFSERIRDVESKENGRELHALMRDGAVRVRCTTLRDPYGPTITEEGVRALALSGETRGGGAACNEKRREKGWKPLDIFEVDVLSASQDEVAQGGFDSKISSTAIRKERAEAQPTAAV